MQNEIEKINRSNCSYAKFIRELVTKSSNIISCFWSLKNFIATNPLQGLENMNFYEAISYANHYLIKGTFLRPIDKEVNRIMIKYLSLYLDQGQAKIKTPQGDLNFYDCIKNLIAVDPELNFKGSQEVLKKNCGIEVEVTLLNCLSRIPESNQEEYLRSSLAKLPGWSSYVKFLESKGSNKISLIDMLAIRLLIEELIMKKTGQYDYITNEATEGNPLVEYAKSFITKENEYRDSLIQSLKKIVDSNREIKSIPEAQFVFCIDVRSEQFRKSIEAQGDFETYGFAGFFGMPISYKNYGSETFKDACPVLLKPRFKIEEEVIETDSCCKLEYDKHLNTNKSYNSIYGSLKYNPATLFPLAESSGLWSLMLMLQKTIFPKFSSIFNKANFKTRPILEEAIGLDTDEKSNLAESALTMMGLTGNFAKFVFLCGHKSHTVNNPYASALDCGACAGNNGAPNAKVLAAILNEQPIRKNLQARDIYIPEDTLFIAAEHDTCTDNLEIFDELINLTNQQKTILEEIKEKLFLAKQTNNDIRTLNFSCDHNPDRRSVDWSQVRPEWGLAKNAAFIVAPRYITEHINLEARAFLHSYDYRIDSDGKYLNVILNAPMIVAQWINSQYYFSTLNNVNFGSGSKITHNVYGKLGVMQGNASDLMHGLPLQSVSATDEKLYHQPIRLNTIVYAPLTTVENIISKSPKLQELFCNDWVKLSVIDPSSKEVHYIN